MKTFLFVVAAFISLHSFAQMPNMAGARRPGMSGAMSAGHLYGKVVDASTNKGLEGASVQLVTMKMDSATKQPIETSLKVNISSAIGDFSLDNVPVFGNLTLKVSAVGFKPVSQKISFGIRQQGGSQQDMMAMIDKDLGNIKMESDPANLGNVTVTATQKRLFEMGVDRKIFNVDKNLMSAGSNATEIMKQIPSLSVDIDGNVTMRNSAPQLFVDGRPTTLTMEQIPSDIIDQVELITNPSAKFDASGGNAGIINIVLKKNKKTGYNGGVRLGTDSRGGANFGGDLNVRQNKVNFFANANLNSRRGESWGITDRTSLQTTPISRIYQTTNPQQRGLFGFGRAGLDYFVDNRNTLSATFNLMGGTSKNNDNPQLDSFVNSNLSAFNNVATNNNGEFRNLGSQISFKHNFAKNGHIWTADANYNASKNNSNSLTSTSTYNPGGSLKFLPIHQKSISEGNTSNLIVQTDYANPITDKQKIELGARASVRDVTTINNQFFYNHNILSFVKNDRLSNDYDYTDKVYAAYATYSLKMNKFNYQFGLRAESSVYTGAVVKSDSAFEVKYPLSLFPSAFITYALSNTEDIQVNISRRINRPNFFQLLPFIDYSDPQNISVGNAGLKPEFTNSFEVSYNKTYGKGANFLASAFGKHNTNLITRFQYLDLNPDVQKFYSSLDSVVFNTYINANSSFTYGLELTNRMPLAKWWDMTANFNLFNSTINVVDPTGKTADIKNQRTSWFTKLNNTFKLPKSWSIQASGDYFAKTVLPSEGGRGGGGGRGGMYGGGPTATAQGYINPRYSVDLGLRKDFAWKGGNSASLTLGVNDVFRTQLYSTYSESAFLTQTSQRRSNPQMVRLNFNYRFGKFDVNLFKRRNDRTLDSGSDMMGQ